MLLLLCCVSMHFHGYQTEHQSNLGIFIWVSAIFRRKLYATRCCCFLHIFLANKQRKLGKLNFWYLLFPQEDGIIFNVTSVFSILFLFSFYAFSWPPNREHQSNLGNFILGNCCYPEEIVQYLLFHLFCWDSFFLPYIFLATKQGTIQNWEILPCSNAL